MSDLTIWRVYRLPEFPARRGYVICRGKELWELVGSTAQRDRCVAIPLIWEGEAPDADSALAEAKRSEPVA